MQESVLEPVLRERQCGGWIAGSNARTAVKIAVTATNREEARAAFFRAIDGWQRNLEVGRSLV